VRSVPSTLALQIAGQSGRCPANRLPRTADATLLPSSVPPLPCHELHSQNASITLATQAGVVDDVHNTVQDCMEPGVPNHRLGICVGCYVV
jgi:hypothetical protein